MGWIGERVSVYPFVVEERADGEGDIGEEVGTGIFKVIKIGDINFVNNGGDAIDTLLVG